MLCKEWHELLAGSVIRQLLRSYFFYLKHFFENSFPMSASLHIVIHIKIENAERLDFLYRARLSSDEQLPGPHFQHAYDIIALSSQIQPVVRGKQFVRCRDARWQFLGRGRCCANPVNDLIQFLPVTAELICSTAAEKWASIVVYCLHCWSFILLRILTINNRKSFLVTLQKALTIKIEFHF